MAKRFSLHSLVAALAAISLVSVACADSTPQGPGAFEEEPTFVTAPLIGGVACEAPSEPGAGPMAGCFWEGLATAAALAKCGGSVSTLLAVVGGTGGAAAPGAVAAAVWVQAWCVGAAAAVGKFLQCLGFADVGSPPSGAGPLTDNHPLRMLQIRAQEYVSEYDEIADRFNEAVEEYNLGVEKLELIGDAPMIVR